LALLYELAAPTSNVRRYLPFLLGQLALAFKFTIVEFAGGFVIAVVLVPLLQVPVGVQALSPSLVQLVAQHHRLAPAGPPEPGGVPIYPSAVEPNTLQVYTL